MSFGRWLLYLRILLQYERCKHTPDSSTLGKLGQVLNVPIAYFYAEDEELALLIKAFYRSSSGTRPRLMTALSHLCRLTQLNRELEIVESRRKIFSAVMDMS